MVEVERDLQKRTEESYRASQMSWRGVFKVRLSKPEQLEEWRREIESHRKLKENYRHLLKEYKKLSNGAEPPPLPPASMKRRRTPKKRNTLLNPENRAPIKTYSLPNINIDKVKQVVVYLFNRVSYCCILTSKRELAAA